VTSTLEVAVPAELEALKVYRVVVEGLTDALDPVTVPTP
jgi:hypothetical protein